MCRMSTGRAGKRMAFALTEQSASAAVLAGISRVDLRHHHASLLCFALDGSPNQLALPLRETAPRRFAVHLFLHWLGKCQRLKDEHGVSRCPLHQLLSCRLGKGARAIALLAARPFEHTERTPRI